MPITFKNETRGNIDNLKQDYFKAARDGEAAEVVEAKYNDYMNAFTSDLAETILAEARMQAMNAALDSEIALNRGLNVLTAKEKQFFTNLVEDEANYDSFKEPKILPETTVLRIFDDIKVLRPLLSKINFQVAGLRTRIIVGKPDGAAVWGEIFGKIQGQILANFTEYSFSQNKLTAFAIVPKDLLEFGPEWVERYVREQLAEAIAVKIEEGVVLGKGAAANEPYGLMKQLSRDSETNQITNVTDKTSSGTLTFANAQATAKELAMALTKLQVNEQGKSISALGEVSIAVNPVDQYMVAASNTIQTANGVWVTSLPFNVTVVPSEFVPKNKAVIFAGKRYYAVQTGAVEIKSYDQTLALEDCDVFVAKQFAHGVPEDNTVAFVYDLKLDSESIPGA